MHFKPFKLYIYSVSLLKIMVKVKAAEAKIFYL